MPRNGSGDVTLYPPPAEASAEAIPPGGSSSGDGAPPFILFMHNGRPVVYQRYMEDVSDVED